MAVLLPPHWQTAAVLLGAWSAGLEVSYRGWATAGLSPAGAGFDATFVERRRVGNWLDDVPSGRHPFVLGLAPAGAPAPDVPAGYRDFATEVRSYLGAAPPAQLAGAGDLAAVGATFGEYGELAAGIAESYGIGPGDRVLLDAAGSEQPLMWLLAPLAAGPPSCSAPTSTRPASTSGSRPRASRTCWARRCRDRHIRANRERSRSEVY
ncbi:TIGR03089 family protein [Paractinoplanes durhamensis]|uniref:TIGR03089 family protein n=1 Tax=Paractinoplanes durhamensis TaxID=113563 RepID=UPI0036431C10